MTCSRIVLPRGQGYSLPDQHLLIRVRHHRPGLRHIPLNSCSGKQCQTYCACILLNGIPLKHVHQGLAPLDRNIMNQLSSLVLCPDKKCRTERVFNRNKQPYLPFTSQKSAYQNCIAIRGKERISASVNTLQREIL